jgi:hypothetical protein
MKAVACALLASAALLSLSRPVPARADQAACLSAIRRVPALVGREGCPVALAAGIGYGYTGAVLGAGDSHHRLEGLLAGEWTAHPALVLGLGLRGRYDRHVLPSADVDDGWTGEPRLGVRYQHDLRPGTRLGLALGVNLPGGEAPSIDLGAVGGDLTALATQAFRGLDVAAKLGYRLDRAANALPEASRLSPADRVGLGVSAFDAVLVGLSVERRRAALALFAETTLDVLLGGPPAAVWPWRLGAGARRHFGAALAAELLVEGTLSGRPSLAVGAPLVEVAPRLAILLGLSWGEARLLTPSPAVPTPPPPVPAPVVEELPSSRGQLRGFVRSYGGRGLTATIRIAGRNGGTPVQIESRGGNFERDLPPGSYDVVIEAEGFVTQRRRITIEENGVTLLNVDLRRGS